MIDLSIDKCSQSCLQRLLNDELIFSFLARYSQKNSDLSDEYQQWALFFNIALPRSSGNKIALLLPSETIGRYSVVVANSVGAYLLNQGRPFEITVFDPLDESYENLRSAMSKIEKEGYTQIIAALTVEGVRTLTRISTYADIYIPTVNRAEIGYAKENMFFGGIDYAKQLELLSHYTNAENIAVFDEPQALSQKLTQLTDMRFAGTNKHITLENQRINFTQLLKTENLASGVTLVLNTQPVRSSLILSQVVFNALDTASALSTQVNYSPMLLTLTQNDDVKNFFVASAIGASDETLKELNSLLQNDLRYNWIAYATSALTALIGQRQNGDKRPHIGAFDLSLNNNQIDYPITIYQIRGGRFVIAPKPADAVQFSGDQTPEVEDF